MTNVIKCLQKNQVDNAIDKLNKAIDRADGNGHHRDWITNCTAQIAIYELLNSAKDTLSD